MIADIVQTATKMDIEELKDYSNDLCCLVEAAPWKIFKMRKTSTRASMNTKTNLRIVRKKRVVFSQEKNPQTRKAEIMRGQDFDKITTAGHGIPLPDNRNTKILPSPEKGKSPKTVVHRHFSIIMHCNLAQDAPET